MKFKIGILILIVSILLLPSYAFSKTKEGRKSALITNVNGKVTIIRASNPTKPEKAGLMMELKENDKVKTGKNSAITVVFYTDGHSETYSSNSTFRVLFTGGKVIAGKKPKKGMYSKRSLRIAHGRRKEFKPKETRHTVKMGREKPVIFVNLSNRKIITLNPTIMWKEVEGAREYEICLKDMVSKKEIWKSKTTKNEVTYPTDASPLKYGGRYKWSISAKRGSDVVGEGTTGFDILSEDKVKDIEKVKNKLKDEISKDPKNTTPRIILAMLYESYGLFEEASLQYRKILELSPDSPRVQAQLNALNMRK